MKPRGSQPASTAVVRWRLGADRLWAISLQLPGPIGGMPLWRRKVAPAARSAVAAGRPSAPARPSKLSPFEWATMNHGGTLLASRLPIMLPALVPTMYSALAGSQPVRCAIASSPPVSQAPPMTPPAPSTRPTLIVAPPCSGEVYGGVYRSATRPRLPRADCGPARTRSEPPRPARRRAVSPPPRRCAFPPPSFRLPLFEVLHRRPLDHVAVGVEARAVARAVPRCLRLVPLHLALQVGADRGHRVQAAI